MAYSIFSFIDENQFVRAWLHRKTLSNSLRSERAKAEFKIENESASDMNVDVELQKYSGTLTSINEDLKSIHYGMKKSASKENLKPLGWNSRKQLKPEKL